MRFVKKLVMGMLILIVVIMAMVSVMMLRDARIDYDVSTEGVSIPTYTAMDINYDQSNHFTESLPFAGSAIIDIDNDGTEELFLGGGPGQNDGLFRFDGDGFVAIADADGISKDARSVTYGASVIDVDGDGRDDLLVSSVAFNPILLLLLSFVVYVIAPSVGKYVMPIALNVAFFIFFSLSTWIAHKKGL